MITDKHYIEITDKGLDYYLGDHIISSVLLVGNKILSKLTKLKKGENLQISEIKEMFSMDDSIYQKKFDEAIIFLEDKKFIKISEISVKGEKGNIIETIDIRTIQLLIENNILNINLASNKILKYINDGNVPLKDLEVVEALKKFLRIFKLK